MLVVIFLSAKWLASDSWVISTPAPNPSIGVYYSPSNHRQYGTTAWLGAYDGKLLMLDGDKFNTLHTLSSKNGEAMIVGQVGQYLYYWAWSTSFWDHSYRIELYCYDLENDTATKLHNSHDSNLNSTNYFAEDGSVYIALCGKDFSEPGGFLHVNGNSILETVSSAPGYQVGNQTVWPDYPQGPVSIFSHRVSEMVYQSDRTGTPKVLFLSDSGGCSVIPTAQGLVIHNENSGNCVFYHIDEHGALHELFNADCMSSRSAVAVHESTVFLSVFRFEKLDDAWGYFVEPFENDTISGTYRINLEDYSVQKISNAAYRRVYLFDHHSLPGCDKYGNIEQIDFNGNVLAVLRKKFIVIKKR